MNRSNVDYDEVYFHNTYFMNFTLFGNIVGLNQGKQYFFCTFSSEGLV